MMQYFEKMFMFIKFKSWKEWTVACTLIIFIGSITISSFIYETTKWMELIILPSMVSLLMGVVVSLWFTIKADNDLFELSLEIELDRLHENLLFTLTKATEIVSNPLFSNKEKIRQLTTYLITKVADTYYIEVKYNDLFLEYYEIIKRDLEFIKQLDCRKTTEEFIIQFNEKFEYRAEEHHQLDVKVLIYREEIFQKRRANKRWILKNKRTLKTRKKLV